MTSREIGSGVIYTGDCLDVMRSFADRRVRLTVGSPPFEGQRLYPPMKFVLTGQKWVDWMVPRVLEMARVTDGLVVINMSSPVVDYRYSPAVEWLVADLTRNCGLVCGPSPYAWMKMENRDDAAGNGIPGSGGRCYQRRDWEPIYCFALPDRLPLKWSDNKAYGTAPRIGSFGGEFSHRDATGRRANDPWKTANRGPGQGPRRRNGKKPTNRQADGKRKNFTNDADGNVKGGHARDICTVANAGNILRVPVGGGKMGHALGSKTDAPFPVGVPARFIAWFCPPGEEVLDPFCGGGTTPQAAEESGRRWIGIDIRESQAELVEKRLGTVTKALFA